MKHVRFAGVLAGVSFLGLPHAATSASGELYRVHALTGARVVTAPGEILFGATIVVRDGVIEAVSSDVSPPPDARVWELDGRTIYPGLIDGWVELGSVGPKKKRDGAAPAPGRPRTEVTKEPGDSHDLPWIQPDREVARVARLDSDRVGKLRDLGFVAAQLVPDDGILRGTSAVIALGDESFNRMLMRDAAAQVVALERISGTYPASLMGVIAAIRQTLEDGRWYTSAHHAWRARPAGRERPEFNRAWAALGPALNGDVPVVFDARQDVLNVLRIGRIVAEHDLTAQVLATGHEYRRLAETTALELPFIVPIDFPEAPEATSEDEWLTVSTDRLRHWQRAPANPGWLQARGATVALTTARLDKMKTFHAKVRAAIGAGLDADAALASLTTVPARLLGIEHLLGSIEAGKVASFVVTDGDLFAEKTRILDVWIDGARHRVQEPKPRTADPVGTWSVRIGDGELEFMLEIEKSKRSQRPRARRREAGSGLAGHLLVTAPEVSRRTAELDCVDHAGTTLIVGIDDARLGGEALLVATIGETGLTGWIDRPDGTTRAARGERLAPPPDLPAQALDPPGPIGGPLLEPEAVIVRDATIWTQGPEGTLQGADLLVVDGRIEALGQDLEAPDGAHVIDAAGRHVSPGLVDAHSHTAITGGVNEGTNAVTAEVRIGDVVNSEDWNIYRQLAGGLTTANLLHGSANPIGGQSQTIKLRWGSPPALMKLADAKPGIKFALGENVKQSNWGDKFTTRYPQTRIGVEQVMRERFLAARDYMRSWRTYDAARKKDRHAIPPRKDLQLETMAEILRGERLVHSHSYRQDEILMLLRLTEEFGVTMATFQHVLEGYKVADELARLGAGASTFSDWWAYKFEVYDAIPWNGALMWDRGVVVSFNSDSRDVARRMNTEATKAVRYGGLPEEAALDFVTINPARQLRVDHRIGSLEPGKDADFVLWSDSPLSTFARAEQTWLDGKLYFDEEIDRSQRELLEIERRDLIAAAEKAGKNNKKRDREDEEDDR